MNSLIERSAKCVFSLFLAVLVPVSLAHAEEMPSFTITIKDHTFSPETTTIPADKKVKIVIKNTDASVEEFESDELRREKIIPGNSEGVVVVGPLKPGIYPFFGEFNPKTAQGKLEVK